MKVYLVQHAKAVDKQTDPERPLSDEGRKELFKVIDYIEKNLKIELLSIAHSGKLRAQQTAEVMGEQIATHKGLVKVKDLEPNADPSAWAQRLGLMKDDFMLIGHLPHLCKLASTLLCGDADKEIVAFQNSGVVCLNRDDDNHWSIDWILTPGLVGE